MSNQYFRFKQFIVYQDKTAMKVCTDACLFGAWTAKQFDGQPVSVLEIGAGTGLLSLMLAQKIGGSIDAVEIDADAATQTARNFEISPWKDRLTLIHSPIQDIETESTYDVIISNPPFYENDLLSDDHQKNMARHSTSLTLSELMTSVKKLLKPDGMLAILIPFRRAGEFEKGISDSGFHMKKKEIVKQSSRHSPIRCMYLLEYGVRDQDTIINEMEIRNDENEYTSVFKNLLHEYYLFEK